MDQTLNWQKKSHISVSQASYRPSMVKILDKIWDLYSEFSTLYICTGFFVYMLNEDAWEANDILVIIIYNKHCYISIITIISALNMM